MRGNGARAPVKKGDGSTYRATSLGKSAWLKRSASLCPQCRPCSCRDWSVSKALKRSLNPLTRCCCDKHGVALPQVAFPRVDQACSSRWYVYSLRLCIEVEFFFPLWWPSLDLNNGMFYLMVCFISCRALVRSARIGASACMQTSPLQRSLDLETPV